jgi:hypothetical protein
MKRYVLTESLHRGLCYGCYFYESKMLDKCKSVYHNGINIRCTSDHIFDFVYLKLNPNTKVI